MEERWFKQAVIYSLDIETYQDADGDGVGDIAGLITRLDYLARLGVTCLWLHPMHPSPGRDDGYDVVDFYGVDPVRPGPDPYPPVPAGPVEDPVEDHPDSKSPVPRNRA